MILSDAHLFQTFTEDYDSVKDLERSIEEAALRETPDMIFLAGDMFDYKKTESVYVKHYEGEAQMIRVRLILEKFGKPVYAIRGNHDKEEILKGLEQTVGNFHYVKNDTKNFGQFSVSFMDSFYETGGYSIQAMEEMEKLLMSVAAKARGLRGRSILLCHETFAPYDNAISNTVVEFLKRNFDLVLDGHMHLWNHNAYSSTGINCLPALLPSKIVKGKYSMEYYEWDSRNLDFVRRILDTPFGYVVVDTQSNTVELRPFNPSKKIVEISLDATDLSLEECRRRLRTALGEIRMRADKDSLIVLPELIGSTTFSPLHLEDIKGDFPELHVEKTRYDKAIFRSVLHAQTISTPTLTVEQLFDKMKGEVPGILEEIKAKGIALKRSVLDEILRKLLAEELLEESSSVQQTRGRLQLILGPVVEVLSKDLKIDKPSNFEDSMSSLLKMVR